MFFKKEVTCPFTKEDFQVLSKRTMKDIMIKLKYELTNDKVLKTTIITALAIGLCCFKVYAAGEIDVDKSGDAFLITARKGLKWVCVAVSILGLYIGAIKDDKKKAQEIVIGCLLIYLGSYVVPWLFNEIDKIFG